MKLPLLSLLVLSFLFISCQGQSSKSVQTIDVKSFSEKLKSTENPQLLDVRTPEEYSTEHIGNAINVNWNGADFDSQASTYDKSKPIFVYCKVGGRSAQAAAKLAELGFNEVYNLEGGIMKWNASGNAKPTEKIIGICDQEYAELIKSSDKVMIDFNAKWCAPCKKMNPYILKFQTEMKNKIKIVQLDADENKTIVDFLKLDGLPVIIVYEKGKEVWRNVGYISEEELRKHL
ncbi:rhodanese-like domain-containing protein [Flavobacterium sp.]|jgi:thioredoxin|uniref:rhodanese-like domain-containing protein n=1 Tax=Flavobacterium sp. TaxID=239 RepID=UPI0037C041D4